MPKMDTKTRAKAEKAEAVTGSFEPIPTGKYLADLRAVEAKKSQAGNPIWTWEFDNIRDLKGTAFPGRQWFTSTLPLDKMPADANKDKWETAQRLSAGRLKAVFEAFGYSLDSDTDEMLGETVVLQVGIETIKQGPKMGERTNRVRAILPLTDDLRELAQETAAGKEDDSF